MLAFIPARGGSKRLPKKNILPFCGKPLIAHTIEIALKCALIDRVIVSTDDKEIKAISEDYGAEVMMRPQYLAGDHVTTAEVLVYTINKLIAKGYTPESVMTLQVTNPLRNIQLIQDTISVFEKNKKNIDSLVTFSLLKQKKIIEIKNNTIKPISYKFGQRSQDIDSLYYETGAIYITKISTILEKNDIFGDRVFPFITKSIFSMIDIDEQIDFEIGELIYKKYNNLFI